ncbi:MAG TPA: hypothetical protein VLA78_11970, partial [Paracoccaceae bacterium]|nr:hypothetical protein [Paracoccaceae bacterium]
TAAAALLPVTFALAAQGGTGALRRAAGMVATSGLAALAVAYPLAEGARRAALARPAEGFGDRLGTAMASGLAGTDTLLKLGGGGALVAAIFGAVWLVLRLRRA